MLQEDPLCEDRIGGPAQADPDPRVHQRIIEVNAMEMEKLDEIALWIGKELVFMNHGEIHVVLKVRDGKVALIEKTKVMKEKPE